MKHRRFSNCLLAAGVITFTGALLADTAFASTNGKCCNNNKPDASELQCCTCVTGDNGCDSGQCCISKAYLHNGFLFCQVFCGDCPKPPKPKRLVNQLRIVGGP